MDAINYSDITQLTADIVSAFVTNNKVEQGELSNLIEKVHLALVKAPAAAAEPEKPNLVPAVPIKKSVTPDTSSRLRTERNSSAEAPPEGQLQLTPEEYRAKVGSLAAIIPWLLRTLLRPAPTSPRKWASDARVAMKGWLRRRKSRASGPPKRRPNSTEPGCCCPLGVMSGALASTEALASEQQIERRAQECRQ